MTYNPMKRGRSGTCKSCFASIGEAENRLWNVDANSGPVCEECAVNDGWVRTEAPKRLPNSSSNTSQQGNKALEAKIDRLIQLVEEMDSRLTMAFGSQYGGKAASMFDWGVLESEIATLKFENEVLERALRIALGELHPGPDSRVYEYKQRAINMLEFEAKHRIPP